MGQPCEKVLLKWLSKREVVEEGSPEEGAVKMGADHDSPAVSRDQGARPVWT